MIEVVSIRFKNRGKSYSFAPNGLEIGTGEKVIVETSKGLEARTLNSTAVSFWK